MTFCLLFWRVVHEKNINIQKLLINPRSNNMHLKLRKYQYTIFDAVTSRKIQSESGTTRNRVTERETERKRKIEIYLHFKRKCRSTSFPSFVTMRSIRQTSNGSSSMHTLWSSKQMLWSKKKKSTKSHYSARQTKTHFLECTLKTVMKKKHMITQKMNRNKKSWWFLSYQIKFWHQRQSVRWRNS